MTISLTVCGVAHIKNVYDTAILVSSDTDLIPAIQYLREEGKKLEYIGFSHQPSYGLIKYSDVRTLLKKEDIEQFQPVKKNQKTRRSLR